MDDYQTHMLQKMGSYKYTTVFLNDKLSYLWQRKLWFYNLDILTGATYLNI